MGCTHERARFNAKFAGEKQEFETKIANFKKVLHKLSTLMADSSIAFVQITVTFDLAQFSPEFYKFVFKLYYPWPHINEVHEWCSRHCANEMKGEQTDRLTNNS